MVPYIIAFTLYIILIDVVWKYRYSISISPKGIYKMPHICLFIVSSLPIILFYGLRVNVGTDYPAYVDIYHEIKAIPVLTYIKQFLHNQVYSEPAYYFINRIAYLVLDDEHTMFLFTGVVLFGVFFAVLVKYKNISRSYAAFVFLMTQFCYAVNGVRFALAYMVVLLGVKYIVEEKPVKFLVCIFWATMFHKSAICCILFYFLKQFKSRKLTKIRDWILYVGVAGTPFIAKIGLLIASKIPFINSYFARYGISSSEGGLLYLWRCAPPILAIIILLQLYNIDLGKYSVLLNIELCRILLLYLGNYTIWASRLDRFAWVSEIILIPYIIDHIRDKRQRWLVGLCFVVWYFFVFYVYYVLQTTDLFPYRAVFF